MADNDVADAGAVLALYAGVLAAGSLQAAAQRLVQSLASDCGLSRVSIGLQNRGRMQLLASSGTDTPGLQDDTTLALTGAMQEAVEQGVALAWPLEAADTAADHIRVEQQALQRRVGGAVASIALGQDGKVFAAVCLERHAGPALTQLELQRIEHLLLLAAPALRWMEQASQGWWTRTWRTLQQAWSELRQPQQRARRRLLGAAALLLAGLALLPLEHSVGGRARVEGAQQRVLSAPSDGFVKTVHVRPGDRVTAGAPLVDLLEEDLRLERERWGSQLAQHENAYASAMAKSDRVGAATSMARMLEAQSQLALVQEQLLRGRIVAPFDALVVQGDLSQAIGAPVRQGDPLLTLASTGAYRVIIEIDELDINQVHPGQNGRLYLSSLPWDSRPVVVERITPLARAVEGRNVFEVQARMGTAPTDLRPGLLGRADLLDGRMPPLWAWGRQALYRIRLAYWSLL